jgi:hypothetical protein
MAIPNEEKKNFDQIIEGEKLDRLDFTLVDRGDVIAVTYRKHITKTHADRARWLGTFLQDLRDGWLP